MKPGALRQAHRRGLLRRHRPAAGPEGCNRPRCANLTDDDSHHGSAGSDFDKPKKNPRRGPNCGAPTPTPVPLRIS